VPSVEYDDIEAFNAVGVQEYFADFGGIQQNILEELDKSHLSKRCYLLKRCVRYEFWFAVASGVKKTEVGDQLILRLHFGLDSVNNERFGKQANLRNDMPDEVALYVAA
jgi:hypothetical protein